MKAPLNVAILKKIYYKGYFNYRDCKSYVGKIAKFKKQVTRWTATA